jgi:uncharacterized coiled-coil protein SlyX
MTRPNAGDRELELRLSDVESLLTYLQKTADDLNAAILAQDRRLDAQERQLARLQATIETLAGSIVELPRRPEEEKPPHY